MRSNTPSTLGFGVTTTWNGTTWNNGAPNVNTVARIAGNYTTATSGSISCLDLFLDSGTITVSANTYIRVNRNITQAASGVVFNVSNNGALALYDPNVDTTSVKLTITRTLPYNVARLDYRVIGDPIGGRTVQSIAPGTLANRIYTYNVDNNLFSTNYFFNATTIAADVASSKFIPGVGFLIRTSNSFSTTPAPWTLTTTNVSGEGKLNSGNVVVPFRRSVVTSTSFVFLTNPYSAPIDLDRFMNANPFLDGIVYEWLRSFAGISSSYVVSNRYAPTLNSVSTLSSTLGTLGVFQGFNVAVPLSATQNSVIFTPDMMVIGNKSDLVDSFSLALKTPGVDLPGPLISYSELRYPVEFKNYTSSIGMTSSTVQMVFKIDGNGYPLYGDMTQRSSIDIDVYGAYNTSATVSLESTFGRFNSATITLQDLVLNTTQNLKSGSYTFPTVAGTTYTGRFKIIIS